MGLLPLSSSMTMPVFCCLYLSVFEEKNNVRRQGVWILYRRKVSENWSVGLLKADVCRIKTGGREMTPAMTPKVAKEAVVFVADEVL